MAQGSVICGSAATSSIRKPFSSWNDLRASFGSSGWVRGSICSNGGSSAAATMLARLIRANRSARKNLCKSVPEVTIDGVILSTSYKGNFDGQDHSDDWRIRYQGGGIWVSAPADHFARQSAAKREYRSDG